MKEIELAEHVLAWLEIEKSDWEVYEEVRPRAYGSVADIVCVRDGDVWVIEAKTSLSLKVIQQAYSWEVNYRSVAVPGVSSRAARQDRKWWYGYLKNAMDIGSVVVSSGGRISEWEAPRREEGYLRDKEHILDLVNTGLLDDFSVKAGSKAGGYWTPYKQSMIEIKEFIGDNPGCGIADIYEALGKLHYASRSSMMSSVASRLKTIESEWCEMGKDGYKTIYYIGEER